jgi:hypothetical protein
MSGRVEPQEHGEWRSGWPRAAQFASRVPRRGRSATRRCTRPRQTRSSRSDRARGGPRARPTRHERPIAPNAPIRRADGWPHGPSCRARQLNGGGKSVVREGNLEMSGEREGKLTLATAASNGREDPRGSRRVPRHVRFVDGTRATVTATAPGSAPQLRRSAAAATGVRATRSVAPGPDGVSTGEEGA